MTDKQLVEFWRQRIKESRDVIKLQSKKWDAAYRLWRGVRPELPGEYEGKRSNLFLQIIMPIILTGMSKELLYYFGRPSPMKIRIYGSDENLKERFYEKALQKFFDFVLSRPEQFQRHYMAQHSKRTYGTIITKQIPTYDNDVVTTEPIAPWNGVWDTTALTNKEMAWAGHGKIVRKDYIVNSDIYDESQLDKIQSSYINEHMISKLDEDHVYITEIWDKEEDEIIVLANLDVLIRRDKMPHYFPYVISENLPTGFIPCDSNSGEQAEFATVGIGISDVEPLRDIQLAYNEITNQMLDNVSRTVHNLWLVPFTEDTWDLEHSSPGSIVQMTDPGSVKPLYHPNSVQTMESYLPYFINEGYRISGIKESMVGSHVSKRQTSEEFSRMIREAHNRVWLSIKYSESSYWNLWAHQTIDGIIESNQNKLFKSIVDSIDPLKNAELYEKIGTPKISDLKSMRIQIEPQPSQLAATETDKRILFLEAMKVAMAIWGKNDVVDPNGDMNLEGAKELYLSTFEESLPGIASIFKSKPMTPQGQTEAYEGVAQTIIQGR